MIQFHLWFLPKPSCKALWGSLVLKVPTWAQTDRSILLPYYLDGDFDLSDVSRSTSLPNSCRCGPMPPHRGWNRRMQRLYRSWNHLSTIRPEKRTTMRRFGPPMDPPTWSPCSIVLLAVISLPTHHPPSSLRLAVWFSSILLLSFPLI